MTRSLSILAAPNDDLAVDRNGRVYKLKQGKWVRLSEWLPKGAAMLEGKRSPVAIEVAA